MISLTFLWCIVGCDSSVIWRYNSQYCCSAFPLHPDTARVDDRRAMQWLSYPSCSIGSDRTVVLTLDRCVFHRRSALSPDWACRICPRRSCIHRISIVSVCSTSERERERAVEKRRGKKIAYWTIFPLLNDIGDVDDRIQDRTGTFRQRIEIVLLVHWGEFQILQEIFEQIDLQGK